MPHSQHSSDHTSGVARVGQWLHRRFLPLLLLVYALAGVAPAPGIALRELRVPTPWGTEERTSMVLLAIILFCAAAAIHWKEVRELARRPAVLLVGLLCTWIGPALLVAVAGQALPYLAGGKTIAGVMVGLALVAAMPVANSSVGWTQNAGGNVALSLGLVVLSIVLSPFSTPNLLKLMGLALSERDTERIHQVVTQFSGREFILWVILPSLAGGLAAWLAGPGRIARAKPWFRIASLSSILLLNYANASLAIDKIWATERLRIVLIAAGLATLVSLVGILLALAQSRAMNLPRQSCIALLFGVSMNHTGLALVLAGEFLEDQPRTILIILLTTLAQHVVAALVDWRLQREPVAPPQPAST